MELPKTSSCLELKSIIDCPICSDVLKSPKVLPCLHTFCLKCLSAYGDDKQGNESLPCPVCRCNFSIPDGGCSELKTNFFIKKLIETGIVSSDEKRVSMCEVCENQLGNVATVFHCNECSENMCEQCSIVHSKMKMSKSHKITRLVENIIAHVKISNPCEYMCERHAKEVKFYCRNCKTLACSVCVPEEHEKHGCSDVTVTTDEFRESVRRGCNEVDVLLANTNKQLRNSNKQLKSFQKTVAEVKENIVKRGEAVKKYVDESIRQLLQKLQSHKQGIETEAEKVNAGIKRQVMILEGLRRYCEEIIQKADIKELMLVSDDIQTQVCGMVKKTFTHVSALPLIEFVPSEDPVTHVGAKMKISSHQNIIGTICVSYPTCKAVQGLTASDERLFVVHNKSSDIEVYDVRTLTFLKKIQVPGLFDPCDIAYTNDNIFVSETDEQRIHWIDLQSGSISSDLLVEGRSLKMSVTPSGDIVVSSFEPPKIHIIDKSRDISKYIVNHGEAVSFTEGSRYLYHAIFIDNPIDASFASRWSRHPHKIFAGCFNAHIISKEASFTSKTDKVSLYELHTSNDIEKTASLKYGDYREFDLCLDVPCYLVPYKDKCVIVADRNNNRIVKADMNTLKIVDVVLPASTGLKRPFTFCLNRKYGSIYVVDGRNQILMFDLEDE